MQTIIIFLLSFLCGALGTIGYFTYTGSTLRWKR